MNRRSLELLTYLLMGISVPVGLFALFLVIAPAVRSNPLAAWLVSVLVMTLMLPVVLRFVRLIGIAIYAHWLKRHPAETEFGITPPACGHCGYDLRASPDYCPECGRAVDSLNRLIIFT